MTTNLLLLLILLVLLIGFGLLAPLLWVLGAVSAIVVIALIMWFIIKKIGVGFEAVGGVLDRIFKPIGLFFENNKVQWCLIVALAAVISVFYFYSGDTFILNFLSIPAIIAVFKGVSYLDTISAKKKYKR